MSTIRCCLTPRLLSGSWVSFLLVLLLSPLNTSAANLTGLSLTPPNPTLNINDTLQLIATGIFDDGTQQVIAQAKQVSAGSNHTCALSIDGTIKCWGLSESGQLGNGSTGSSLVPVTVSGIKNAVTISAGYWHNCALLVDGTLRCWGNNSAGQLGNGTTTDSSTPIAVSGINTAVAISAGSGHTCAVLANNTVRCWGFNGSGQLGNGTTTNSSAPVTVSGIKTAVAVSAGGSHTCAVLADSTVRCWGSSSLGQLGNSSFNNSLTPVTVSGISTATVVRAGGEHTCAALTNGTLRCWGSNVIGQLGNGGATADSSTPVTVSGISTAVDVSAGPNHNCAVLADGTARCWGRNDNGKLGNGTTTLSSTPVTVSGLSTGVGVSVGFGHTCAVLADGTVKCWGTNFAGQLGIGTTTYSLTPVIVSGISTAVAVSAGVYYACGLLADGTIKCWGQGALGNGTNTKSSTPVTVSGISTAVAVSVGNYHACSVLADGTIKCWGDNRDGQLGNGTTTSSLTPVTVSGITTAVAVTASGIPTSGGGHSCALLADGTVRCWGGNGYGQLGNSNFSNSLTPIAVSGINTAKAVSTGGVHSCAVLVDGTARCWGSNFVGQLGNGAPVPILFGNFVFPDPVTVSGINTAVAISAGEAHSCARLVDGTIKCWGGNGAGQLGTDTSTLFSSIPIAVNGISTAVAFDAGIDHNCAALADGTLRCWGSNVFGKLGSGMTTYSYSSTPVTVSGISTAVAAGAGFYFSCAVLADGTIKCWGDNSSGQLGDGTSFSSYYTTPTFTTLGYFPLAWTSSNPTVATVNKVGKTQALASGTTLITANLNGLSASTLITVPTAPIINGFWPGSVPAGQMVLVFGQGFIPQKSQVQVNGISAPFVEVLDPTFLFFMLPPGNTNGPITVTTPYGTATSSTRFGTPLTGVKITGLWPSVATPGQLVIVFGSGFVVNGTTVKLNGVDAPIRQVLYPDLMFFMVPPTATTGYVTVTTAAGSATSASLLTVK